MLAQFDNYDSVPQALSRLPRSVQITKRFGEFRQIGNDDQEAKRTARRALPGNVRNAIGARIYSAIATQDQFAERLADFWVNHFAV